MTLIGLLACMLDGEYSPEVAESALKFSFYALGAPIFVCMYSEGVIE